MQNKLRRFGLRTLRKMRFLPSKHYVHYHYEYFSGKKLDLKNPMEFNAKIEWYKVFFRPKILNQLVDKYAVRAYVEDKIGASYLNELIGVYTDGKDIPFDDLPNKFVIKATHTSSYNLIVKDKSQLEFKKVIPLLNKWLKKNQYYRMGQEWAYKDVQPRLVVEKFLKEEDKNTLVDYKFYCFDGVPKFIDVHIDREEDHKQGCFDLEFNLLPFGKSLNYKSISEGIMKPTNLKEMIEVSKKLSENFPFVRVDLYSVNGRTVFGEMTFYPSDARKEFYPKKYNEIIGNYFKLPSLDSNERVITNFP
ncbi:ATP-grasp fold amidoligase family protein [Dokdonia sp. Hel_I_53]|uniref:ATP-grasp fold amidoligase family protein n=1 Tax=Dokdonia sp. Hel_I_53 TaxID=1566287 RepID=UPI0021BD1242|nr:ATP-grasp fold amidoligase family protein [Dokdonia sp. Hel_I_53]